MGIGLYLVRLRRRRLNLPRPTFRAWEICVVLYIMVQLYVVILSWYPPATGATGGDVSFWYGTYIVTGYGIVILCAIYYALWIWLVPRWKGYRMRQELVELDNGVLSHRLLKIDVGDLERWDATHDATGRLVNPDVQTDAYRFSEKAG